MKITYHIPTEQYGFIEVEYSETENTPAYEEVKNMFDTAGPGLTPKEFNAVVDRYLNEADMDSELYASMNSEQKTIIQCLKRAFKRIKAHEGDGE